MEYISTREAAEKWGVSLRCVQRFLHEGRVSGAKKYGVTWLIPYDSEKPTDPRKKENQVSQRASRWFLLTPVMFNKRDQHIEGNKYPSRYYPLLEADIAYRRGNPDPAMNMWKNAENRDPGKLTAATIATVAAISAGDFILYNDIQKNLAGCMARAKDEREVILLSLPETLAAVSMAAVNMIPRWLKTGDFSLFPREHIPLLLYLYTLYLRNINETKAVLYTAKASYELCAQQDSFTWIDVYNLTLCAQASFDLGDKEQAKEYLLSAMKLGLPAGFIAPFADYLGTMGGLVETCLHSLYPQFEVPVTALWSRSFKNWMIFHNRFTSENITTMLTPQEYQLARYIAHGASYNEAARQMNLSVGRVKNILLDIYGELHINKRSQLSSFVT